MAYGLYVYIYDGVPTLHSDSNIILLTFGSNSRDYVHTLQLFLLLLVIARSL